jgi:hypothetical protein
VPVRNLSSATQLRPGWSIELGRPGSKAEPGRGIEFANPRTPEVAGERDPRQAVVGWKVSSGDALVPMMESAEVRNRQDTLPGRRREGAWVRAVLVQRVMGARGIVVGEVCAQQPMERPLVQDRDVVEALSFGWSR